MHRAVFALLLTINAIQATLIVEIQVPDGIVLCADRRVIMKDPAYQGDRNVKIFILGNTCSYTVTGLAAFFEPRPHNQLVSKFSIHEVIEKYFSQHPCSQQVIDLDSLASYVTGRLNTYLQRSKKAMVPNTRIIVIHSKHLSPLLLRVDCPIDIVGNNQVTTTCTEKTIAEVHHYSPATNSRTLVSNGDTEQASNENTLNALRVLQQQSEIKAITGRVFTGPTWSMSDAETLARLIIKTASTSPPSSQKSSSISPACDCIHQTVAAIQWLNKPIATTLLGRPEK